MKTLVDFVNSTTYDVLLENVKLRINIEIDDNIPDVVWGFSIKELNLANVTVDDLKSLIELHTDSISAYVEIKLKKYSDDIEQEYPEGYEPEEENDEIVNLPFYKNFLIIYLAEYWILKENPKEIENYVRALRIPYAKKYAKEITVIYNDINSSK
ncbi:hypothetical protein [Flavobacterium sp. H4147]|uniref:hypothetical protein n=1 Tax=Flavobacterium sp. H4147 TaxID=3034149 RepID=UPI0023EDE4C4|nr:hypothetical protein [Flavobacterium sp. H4147]